MKKIFLFRRIYVYIYKVLYFLKYEKVVRSYILLLYNCGNKIRLFKLLFIYWLYCIKLMEIKFENMRFVF